MLRRNIRRRLGGCCIGRLAFPAFNGFDRPLTGRNAPTTKGNMTAECLDITCRQSTVKSLADCWDWRVKRTSRESASPPARTIIGNISSALKAGYLQKSRNRIGTNRKAEMTNPTNPNCDGGRCVRSDGEVRVLPLGGDSNVILCDMCFHREIRFRAERNRKVGKAARFSLPDWQDLEIYDNSPVPGAS